MQKNIKYYIIPYLISPKLYKILILYNWIYISLPKNICIGNCEDGSPIVGKTWFCPFTKNIKNTYGIDLESIYAKTRIYFVAERK